MNEKNKGKKKITGENISECIQNAGQKQMGGFIGNLFQLKLLMLFLYRGLLWNYNFELGTEISEAYKFDDVVFKYKKKNEKIDHYCILQAKHSIKENKKIKLVDILTRKDVNFGLIKYYLSYKEAKRETLFKSSVIEHTIVYTNLDIEHNDKWKDLYMRDTIEEVYPEKGSTLSICKIDGKGKYYRFKTDILLPIVKPMINEYIYLRLANRLVKFLLNKKCLLHYDVVFKNYHKILAKQVIDVNKYTFHDDFINLNENEDENSYGPRKLKIALKKVLKDANIDLETVFDKSKHKFILSKGFGETIEIKKKEQKWLRGDIRVFSEDLKKGEEKLICEHNLTALAIEFIECLLNHKRIDKNEFIFKEFHMILARDVVNVKDKKIYDSFIKLSEKPKLENKLFKGFSEFRQKFIAEIEKRGFNFQNINDYIKNGKMTIILCENFGEREKEIEQFWPVINDNDEEIRNFFKIFLLAVRQPNEHSLGEKIQEYLNYEYSPYDTDFMFKYFMGEMQNWMKGKRFLIRKSDEKLVSKFISSEIAEEFFRQTERKFNGVLLKGPTVKYEEYIKKFEIHFDDIEIKQNIEDFITSEKKVLIISSEHITITSIKVYQNLNELKKKLNVNIDDKINYFIYTKLSSMIDSCTNFVIKAFESKFIDHLLIIECDMNEHEIFGENKGKLYEIYQDIFYVLKNHENKQIVFITQKETPLLIELSQKFSNVQIEKKNDNKNNFLDLSVNSQDHFLQKKIKFQGFDVPLKDVISNESKNAIDGKILLHILKGEEIKIGKQFENIDYINNFYINRKLIRELRNENEIYLISEIDESDLYSNIDYGKMKIITEETRKNSPTSEESELYETTLTDRPSKNVCLLRKKNNQLIMLENFEHCVVSSSKFPTLKGDIILISAIAGMGKSVLFTNLSKKMKENNPHLWVIKIDLNASSKKLDEIKGEYYNSGMKIQLNTVIDFLFLSADINSTFEKDIFKCFLHENKIVIFFDAFDEISPRYKKIVIEIVKILQLKTKIKEIWISTRPYEFILNDLKSNFKVEYYTLEAFSENDQNNFLKTYWKKPLEPNFDEKFFDMFVANLFEILRENTNQGSIDFLGVALHIMMIALILKPTFEKFHKINLLKIDEEQQKELKNMLELSTLYEKFVKMKCFELYCGNKINVDLKREGGIDISELVYEKFVKKCQILSLESLFDYNIIKTILTKNQEIKLHQFKIEILENGERIGIINQIIDGKAHFIHRTFAEYFTADYFIEKFNNVSRSDNVIKFFFKNVLNDKNKVICTFIDGKLNKDTIKRISKENIDKIIENSNEKLALLCFVIENKWAGILKFLIENGINLTHNQFQTVLHVVIAYENENIFKIILEKLYENPDEMKKLFKLENVNGHTFLLSAVIRNNIKIVKTIFDVCDKLKLPKSELIGKSNEGWKIIHHGIKTNNEILLCLLVQFKSDPELLKSLIEKNNDFGETPLLIATKDSNEDAVKIIVKICKEFNILERELKKENNSGWHVLNHVVYNNNSNILEYMLVQFERYPKILESFLQKKDHDGDTTLLIAGRYADLNNMKIIIRKYSEFKILEKELAHNNKDGLNVVHCALLNENCHVLKYLLEKCADTPNLLKSLLQQKEKHNYSPLFYAAISKNQNHIQIIFEIYDEFEISKTELLNEHKGQNIIHVAANKHVDILKYILIQFQKYPNTLKLHLQKTDFDGNTPLLIAVKQGNIENTKVVLEKCRENEILEDELVKKNGDKWNIMHFSVCNDDSSVLSYVLDQFEDYSNILKSLLKMKNAGGLVPLLTAAERGNIHNIKLIIHTYKNSNILTNEFKQEIYKTRNIIHCAACNKNCDVLIFLLNEINKNDETLKSLFEEQNESGDTPLMVAVKSGTMCNVVTIIEKCYEFDIPMNKLTINTKNGSNILHYAILNQNCDFFKLSMNIILTENNIVLSKMLQQKNELGLTPLLIAAMREKNNKLKIIFESYYSQLRIINCMLESVSEIGFNVMHYSVILKKSDVFEYLLSQFKKYPEKLKLLLTKKSVDGDIPLFVAARCTEMDVLRLMFETYRKLNILKIGLVNVNIFGDNIIHCGILNEQRIAFQYLLSELKKDLNTLKLLFHCTNYIHETPLNLAVKNKDINKIKSIFVECGNFFILKMELENASSDTRNIIFHALSNENSEILRYVLKEFMSNPNDLILLLMKTDLNIDTPLLAAAKLGNIQNMEIIIQTYEMLNILENELSKENERNWNTIHCAVSNQNSIFLKYLLNKLSSNPRILKSIIHKKDKYGETPFCIAMKANKYDSVHVITKKCEELGINREILIETYKCHHR